MGRRYNFPKRAFNNARDRAELPHVRFHDFRHTWVSWLTPVCSYPCLITLKGDLKKSDMTLRYTHPSWEQKLAGVAALPRILTTDEPSADGT